MSKSPILLLFFLLLGCESNEQTPFNVLHEINVLINEDLISELEGTSKSLSDIMVISNVSYDELSDDDIIVSINSQGKKYVLKKNNLLRAIRIENE